MAIDRKKIIEQMSKVSVIGNEEGMIPAFGVYVQQLPADFWNGFARRIVNSVPEDLADVAENLLVNAALECGYHTGYGIITSDEWNQVVGPMIENAPEDVLHTTTVYTEVRRANQAGLATLTGCDNPFKIAYFMRRYEDFLIDCLERPEYARELLERIAAVEFTRAENGVRAGARCAMIFGDFAHQQELMVSPTVFRTVLRPILEEFVLRLKAINPKVLVFLHSDGNLSSVLPDLIECGFAAELYRQQYRDRCAGEDGDHDGDLVHDRHGRVGTAEDDAGHHARQRNQSDRRH